MSPNKSKIMRRFESSVLFLLILAMVFVPPFVHGKGEENEVERTGVQGEDPHLEIYESCRAGSTTSTRPLLLGSFVEREAKL